MEGLSCEPKWHLFALQRDVGMKDTLFDDLVFEAGELLHHDVDEAGNEARQEADQTADDPAADLQTAETLRTANRSYG